MQKFLDQILLSNRVVDDFYAVYNNIKIFRDKLNQLIPQVELCNKQEQNNPWHKYNVLGHTLHSVEAINKLSLGLPPKERRLLAYVMFFHDMGKPACHIQRMKGGKMIDSFFNHNIESAKIAKEVAPKLGFSEEETAIIEKLVFKHDIFMFIKPYPVSNKHWEELSYRLIRREIKDLDKVGDGYYLLKLLVLVGRADSLAQNEAMTTFELHDKFDQMLADFPQKEQDEKYNS